MNKLFVKMGYKLITSLLLLAAFIYLVILMVITPNNYTIRYSQGSLISSYSFNNIISGVNKVFVQLFNGDLNIKVRGDKLYNILPDYFWNTIIILTGGILLGIVLGIIKGLIDSNRGKKRNKGIQILTTIIPVSLPDVLIIAILVQINIFLSKHGIKIFRVAGSGTINHTFLPIIALSLLPAFYIARTLAVSIDNCYAQDYIKTALGKGCSSIRILWKHVLRNATGIVFESLSNMTAIIICNLMLVEFLFSYRGLTTLLMTFLHSNPRNGSQAGGIIVVIVLIGLVYFIFDILFNTANILVNRSKREESI